MPSSGPPAPDLSSPSSAASMPPTGSSPPARRVDLNKSRYDLTTWLGRLRHFTDVTDPRTLFTTTTKLREAELLLQRYADGTASPTEEEIWQAKKLCDAMLHPDTKEIIPLPFRMSAFVPANLLIAAGMLLPSSWPYAPVMWQWINQSYNICVNHANRNASNALPTEKIVEAYLVAVGVSCGTALTLSAAVRRSTSWNPRVRKYVQMFIPFTSVALAGVVNVFLMRQNEIRQGIEVKDASGNVVGKSQKAGLTAVSQVAASRVVAVVPILTIAPLVMDKVARSSFISKHPRFLLPANLAIIAAFLQIGLPPAIALFPQLASANVNSIEPRFHNLKDSTGNPLTTVYFNRGL